MSPRDLIRLVTVCLVAGADLAAAVAPAAAQDTVVVAPDRRQLRGDSRQWAVDRFNAPGTFRVFGPLTLDSTTQVRGDVAVVDGPLVVYGSIAGDLIAINADVTLAAGASVAGDVVVLGGQLVRDDEAILGGSSRWESGRVAVRRVGDQLVLAERRPVPVRRARRYDERDRGRAFLVIGLGDTYNRVEGLPLRLGAGLEWQSGDLGGRVRGYGVFRTAGDFSGTREDLGYGSDGQLQLGTGIPRLTLGGRAYDLVVPTQDWPLTRHEAGWATFLWHRDYRDYFLQRGVAGFVTLEPFATVALTGEITRVNEASIAARDPWTPFRNAEAWRPNPVIDAGVAPRHRRDRLAALRAIRRLGHAAPRDVGARDWRERRGAPAASDDSRTDPRDRLHVRPRLGGRSPVPAYRRRGAVPPPRLLGGRHRRRATPDPAALLARGSRSDERVRVPRVRLQRGRERRGAPRAVRSRASVPGRVSRLVRRGLDGLGPASVPRSANTRRLARLGLEPG
jgi:hypothetical protein